MSRESESKQANGPSPTMRSSSQGEERCRPSAKAAGAFAGLLSRSWFWPMVIFAVALLARLYFLWAFAEEWEVFSTLQGDAQGWDCLGMNVLLGKGYAEKLLFFTYRTLGVPFFSLTLSFLYFYIGHSPVVARILQLPISSLTCVFVFKTMEIALGSRKAGVLAGLVSAVYLPFIYYSHVLITETLFMLLFVVSIYFVLASIRERSTKRAILGGIFGGLATLTRAAMSSLLILFALWYLVVLRKDLKQLLRIGCVGVACFALVLFPWLLRSYLIHGAPIMGTVGYLQFWTGSNPRYEGSFYNKAARREALWKKPGATEGERTRMLMKEAIGFISENPYRYLGYCSRRYRDFWDVPRPRLEDFSLSLLSISRSVAAFIFPLAPFGMILSLRKRRELFLLLGLLLFFSGAHAVFGAETRYRVPVDWIFIGYASFFICAVFEAAKKSLANFPGLGWTSEKVVGDIEAVSPRRVSPRVVLLKRASLAAAAALLAVYLARMTWLYVFSGKEEFGGYDSPSVEKVEEVLEEAHLLSLWEGQGRQMPTVDEIFQRRVASGDYLSPYPPWIVVWTGEMRYILESEEGFVENFRFYVNAKGRNLGEGQFFCLPAAEGRHIHASAFRGGEVATVIGYTSGEILGAPFVSFVDILPYEDGESGK